MNIKKAKKISDRPSSVFLQKQAKDYLGVDGDEESAMYEDSVSPAKYVRFLGFQFLGGFLVVLWILVRSGIVRPGSGPRDHCHRTLIWSVGDIEVVESRLSTLCNCLQVQLF